MNMKKALLLLLLSLFILLASCIKSEAPDSAPEEPHVTEPPHVAITPPSDASLLFIETGDVAAPADPIVPIKHYEMSDDIFDFTVRIDGDVFELPIPLEVFMSYGWESARELSGTMLPGDNFLEFGSGYRFVRGDRFISVNLGFGRSLKGLKA